MMSNTSVQLAAFASTFSSRAQKLTLVQENSDENFKNIYSRSNKLVKLSIESIFRMLFSYISNNIPTGSYVFICSQIERHPQTNAPQGNGILLRQGLFPFPFGQSSHQRLHSTFYWMRTSSGRRRKCYQIHILFGREGAMTSNLTHIQNFTSCLEDCLTYEFCYTHIHNSNSFRNFRVFSIQ